MKLDLKKGLANFAATTTITSLADVESTISSIVSRMITFFWILSVLVMIWSAFTFLTAGDSEEKVDKAKKILLYAVIAAAIALLATSVEPITRNILRGQ
ncbi:MAG: hypothetical protein ABSF47_00040 [Minisyncoccia bacterium]|jgi:hypothetical protein